MPGGSRLLWIVACLSLMAALAWAEDNSASTTTPPAGPPKAKMDVVEETLHGHKIADPYRWMEDANSPDSQEYVRAEMAYTRSLLDPLPGRDRIHERLDAAAFDWHHRNAADRRALLFLYPARRHAEPARASGARRSAWKRPAAGGREPDVRRWHGRARLVVSFRRRQVRGLRHLGQRLRKQHAVRD